MSERAPGGATEHENVGTNADVAGLKACSTRSHLATVFEEVSDLLLPRNSAELTGGWKARPARTSASGAGQVGNLPHGGSCDFQMRSDSGVTIESPSACPFAAPTERFPLRCRVG